MDLRLSHLAIEAKDLEAWGRFAGDVLGLEVISGQTGLALRMDERPARFFLEQGEADDVSAIGWEVDDEAALDAVARRLAAAGFDAVMAPSERASRRHVARMLEVRDPSGIPTEIVIGGEKASPWRSKVTTSPFVTADQGMGHVVVSARDRAASERFYREILGFRLSDKIVCEIHGYPVDITFLHGSRRHHSVAIGAPLPKKIHHFMLEVGSLDDVGLAFDRALRAGVKIMQTIGRHPNDRMVSFYAETPSGFQFEYGWGARSVDDATWSPTTYDHISEWGHHPPGIMGKRR